ncbi:unnamed protein product [Mytilus edulis]|uniref:Uncharacterized protein n=1 Tax=Mytilus edulis TaxID=6550 RepID=A0A8S3UU90_MYTED|nr:unnamed protein product [Mytilus edulis]
MNVKGASLSADKIVQRTDQSHHEYPLLTQTKDAFYGCYMGKFPMNSQRLSFEVEIQKKSVISWMLLLWDFVIRTTPENCVFAESMVPKNLKDKEKYKKGDKTHQYTMTMRSDGLFPTVFTNGNISKEVTLRVLNFYAETEENRKKANLRDYEFIAVQVDKTAGNLQLIEEQLNGRCSTVHSETINESIEYYEK